MSESTGGADSWLAVDALPVKPQTPQKKPGAPIVQEPVSDVTSHGEMVQPMNQPAAQLSALQNPGPQNALVVTAGPGDPWGPVGPVAP